MQKFRIAMVVCGLATLGLLTACNSLTNEQLEQCKGRWNLLTTQSSNGTNYTEKVCVLTATNLPGGCQPMVLEYISANGLSYKENKCVVGINQTADESRTAK